MIIGALFFLNLGFLRKLIFLFIFSMILKLACFSDSLRLYKYAGLVFFLVPVLAVSLSVLEGSPVTPWAMEPLPTSLAAATFSCSSLSYL